MANTYAGVFQTLAAAFNEASLAKKHRNTIIDSVTKDFSPEFAAPYSTLNTNIANSGFTPTNLASGSTLTISNVNLDPGVVSLNYHETLGVDIPSLDLAKAGSGFVAKIRDELLKSIENSINMALASLFTTANFNSYNVVYNGNYTETNYFNGASISATDMIFTETMNVAWQELVNNYVPIHEAGDSHLLMPPVVYGNVLTTNPNWFVSMATGDTYAGDTVRSGALPSRWNISPVWDADMNTALGTGGYLSCLFHRYAIALVARAIPAPANPNVPCAYVNYRGLPVRIILDYWQPNQSDRLTADVLFGCSVVRPDHGIMIQSS